MNLKKLIRTIPDFPEPGIQFKDIESITQDASAMQYVTRRFNELCEQSNVNRIVALDARGFLFGGALAVYAGLPLAMARKKGKLAGTCVSEAYSLEYGTAELELQESAIQQGDQIMIIDDLLATGGTASAAASMVERLGGIIKVFAFVIELEGLGGRNRLGIENVISLVKYN